MFVDVQKFDRVFVISDIHGCTKTLSALIEKISPTKDDCIIFDGDFVNYHNPNRDILNFLNILENQTTIYTIIGNHEWKIWHSDARFFFEGYEKYFLNDIYYIETEKFLITHAGFNFNNNNIFEDKEHMMTKINETIDKTKTQNRRIVRGHKPIELSKIIDSVENKKDIVPIDNGCIHLNKKFFSAHYGHLIAFEIKKEELFYVKNTENL